MNSPTPGDRLRAVERHAYDVQAVAEALDLLATHAHLTNREDIGFALVILVERLRDNADAILSAATEPPKGKATR